MWKKAAFVVGFLALLFVADRGIAEALARLVAHSNLRVSMLYSGRVNAEVVIIGNSRGVHLASSDDWGKTLCRSVFNLSLNGLDVKTQDVLLRDLLERNPAPKFVVIEISSLFSDTFTAPQLRPFIGESERLATLIRSGETTIFPWLDISHLYRFNTEYLVRAMLFLLRASDQTPEPTGHISAAKIAAYLQEHPRYDVNAEAVAVLASTLDALKAHGVEPVLVLAPYHPAAFKLQDWRAEALAEVRRRLPDNVAIYDWSTALEADAAFADPLHMTPEGRRALVAEVAMSPLGRHVSLCPSGIDSAAR